MPLTIRPGPSASPDSSQSGFRTCGQASDDWTAHQSTRAASATTIPPNIQSELKRSHCKIGSRDKMKPSPGTKNHSLTTRSTSGKSQKKMLVAEMPNRNAMTRRPDFAQDENGVRRDVFIAAGIATASLQKTCNWNLKSIAVSRAAQTRYPAYWLACGARSSLSLGGATARRQHESVTSTGRRLGYGEA